jgi:hypothetical protein
LEGAALLIVIGTWTACKPSTTPNDVGSAASSARDATC